ncbi:MAG TPA: undecaprenyl-phosphate glucose phosphotransferase [Candidatus Kapabacteria bacterium]
MENTIATPIPSKSSETAVSAAASAASNAQRSIAARRTSLVARKTSNVVVIRLLQFVTDLVLLNVTYHVMLLLRFGAFFAQSPERLLGAPWSIYAELEIFLNVFWAAIALVLRVYRPVQDGAERPAGNLDQVRSILRAGLVLGGCLLLFIVAQGGYEYYSRLYLAYLLTAIPLVLVGMRVISQSAATTVRQQKSRKNILVIGAGTYGERFYETLRSNPNYGYRVLGFLDDNGVDSGVREGVSQMILGKLADLRQIAERQTIDEVVIALENANEETLAQFVAECEDRCIRVALLPSDDLAYGPLAPRTVEKIGEFSLVRMREAPLDQLSNRFLKRSFDIAFSLLVLITIFPLVFIVSTLLIKLSSKGPIFFRQARTGEDGRTFTCFKLRTMRPGDGAHVMQASKNDPRLTWSGRILRRTSMDELPQFWNVLRGDMSVIGPRPHMLKHTEDYRKIIAQYMVRHFVKPGLTGWAQVCGYRGETKNPELMQRRIEHDLYYIENWSFLFDLTIVLRTVLCILEGDENAY